MNENQIHNLATSCTVFENHRKSLIQHCELRLHFEWTKLIKNAKNGRFNGFIKTEACIQTVLPDRSVLIRQNWRKMPKIQMRLFEDFSNYVYYLLGRKLVCLH